MIPIPAQTLEDGNLSTRKKASGVIAVLSYDKGDRDALVDAGAIPSIADMSWMKCLICMEMAQKLCCIYMKTQITKVRPSKQPIPGLIGFFKLMEKTNGTIR